MATSPWVKRAGMKMLPASDRTGTIKVQPKADPDCPECYLPISWHKPAALARCASGYWRDDFVDEGFDS